MKANVTHIRETAKNFPPSRNGFDREIAVLDPKTGRAVLTARIYQPGTQVTCLLWVYGSTYGCGIGRASGYGYHKASAALQDAISDAGITLHGDVYGRTATDNRANIGGVGDSAMLEACEAIARAVTGKRRFIVHVAHG